MTHGMMEKEDLILSAQTGDHAAIGFDPIGPDTFSRLGL